MISGEIRATGVERPSTPRAAGSCGTAGSKRPSRGENAAPFVSLQGGSLGAGNEGSGRAEATGGEAQAFGAAEADVLAALASAQKDITTAIARTAAQNADPARVADIVARLGALQEAQRAHAEQLGRLAGAMAPPPCPVAASVGSSP